LVLKFRCRGVLTFLIVIFHFGLFNFTFFIAKDYYKILGVQKRRRPTRSKRPIALWRTNIIPIEGSDAEKFKEVNEAYQVLSDKQKRQQYDQFGNAFDGKGFSGFGGGQTGQDGWFWGRPGAEFDVAV